MQSAGSTARRCRLTKEPTVSALEKEGGRACIRRHQAVALAPVLHVESAYGFSVCSYDVVV